MRPDPAPSEPTTVHGHAEASPATDYAGAIYGSIIATAFVGALRQAHVSARDMTIEVAASMVVFWLAHTWAAVAGERIHMGHRLAFGRVRALGRMEWPIVEAGFGPVVALSLGWIGVLSTDAAAGAAIAIGVVQLLAWGFVLGRRVYHTWVGAVVAGIGNGLVGLVLVVLEIAVAH
jgi:hypothetical protein